MTKIVCKFAWNCRWSKFKQTNVNMICKSNYDDSKSSSKLIIYILVFIS